MESVGRTAQMPDRDATQARIRSGAGGRRQIVQDFEGAVFEMKAALLDQPATAVIGFVELAIRNKAVGLTMSGGGASAVI
jgi:hypothetical protein